MDAERPTRAAPSPPDPFLGQILGGCRIDEVIGRGGMGVVYKATQLSLNRPVAIKVLPEEVCGQTQFVERFKREVDILARLSHPNVVTVFERGEIDGRLYVVMEYVQGTSLREVMRKGPLPSAEALVIVRGVLSALEHAHGKGIIHRDVKPENVLVAPGGIVKVADFGLSRLTGPEEATRLTQTNLLLGTYEYMAPEQRERAKQADERADIYATGVVLYEMLAGELPIGHFAALSRKRPKECDSRIDEIVEKSLAKSPEDRYQRASEMGAAVSRVLSAAMAPPPEPPRVQAEPVYGAPPEVRVGGKFIVEDDGHRSKQWKKRLEDPAKGVGCAVFLVVLLLTRGFFEALLATLLVVVVVRVIAGSRSVTRGLVGLLVAGAAVGAVVLFAGGVTRRAAMRDDAGRRDAERAARVVESSVARGTASFGATLPLGSATAPLPGLEGFLDPKRVVRILSDHGRRFDIDPLTVRLEVAEGKVVLAVRSWQAVDTNDLRRFGAAVARALEEAYPAAFTPDPGLPVADAAPPDVPVEAD